MVIAVGSLSLLDASIKILAPHYSTFQIASLRGFSALPFVIVWIGLRGGFAQLVHVRFGLHALRGALGIMALVTFAFALRRLPLAEAYSIFFVAPLMITALAVFILKERVEWQRWVVIAIGFCGVLIVLRPTGVGALTLSGLAVLATAFTYSLSAITVRVALNSTGSDSSLRVRS